MTSGPWTVLFTATAASHVAVIDEWWQANKEAAAALFHDELAAAIERLSRVPGTGVPATSLAVAGVRRVLLPRCRYHVYYTLQPARREVMVRAVWHASRGKGPELGPATES